MVFEGVTNHSKNHCFDSDHNNDIIANAEEKNSDFKITLSLSLPDNGSEPAETSREASILPPPTPKKIEKIEGPKPSD
jgi:hypothetical protein